MINRNELPGYPGPRFCDAPVFFANWDRDDRDPRLVDMDTYGEIRLDDVLVCHHPSKTMSQVLRGSKSLPHFRRKATGEFFKEPLYRPYLNLCLKLTERYRHRVLAGEIVTVTTENIRDYNHIDVGMGALYYVLPALIMSRDNCHRSSIVACQKAFKDKLRSMDHADYIAKHGKEAYMQTQATIEVMQTIRVEVYDTGKMAIYLPDGQNGDRGRAIGWLASSMRETNELITSREVHTS